MPLCIRCFVYLANSHKLVGGSSLRYNFGLSQIFYVKRRLGIVLWERGTCALVLRESMYWVCQQPTSRSNSALTCPYLRPAHYSCLKTHRLILKNGWFELDHLYDDPFGSILCKELPHDVWKNKIQLSKM